MADEQPRRGRPKTGVTPLRNIRIDDETWASIKEVAAERGESMTDLMIRAAKRELARLHRAKAVD